MTQTPKHTHSRSTRPRGLIWLVIALAVALAAYGALRIYMRYGGDDVTVAMQMVYGMLLLVIGMAVLAFLSVALVKLIRFLTRGARVSVLDSVESDSQSGKR